MCELCHLLRFPYVKEQASESILFNYKDYKQT